MYYLIVNCYANLQQIKPVVDQSDGLVVGIWHTGLAAALIVVVRV